jgi:hypothetical protein
MKIMRMNRAEMLLPRDQIDAAVTTFAELLGVEFAPPYDYEDHHVLTTVCWRMGLEIIAPSDAESRLNEFLAIQGGSGAAGPMVWEVADAAAMQAHVEALGLGVSTVLEDHGSRMIYLNPAECLGYSLSFIEQPPSPPESAPGSGAHVKRFDGVEFLLPPERLPAAGSFFGRLFGVEFAAPTAMPEYDLHITGCKETGLTLLAPNHASPYSQPLKSGRCIGSIRWEVEDAAAMKGIALAQGHKVAYENETKYFRELRLDQETLFGYMPAFIQYLH